MVLPPSGSDQFPALPYFDSIIFRATFNEPRFLSSCFIHRRKPLCVHQKIFRAASEKHRQIGPLPKFALIFAKWNFIHKNWLIKQTAHRVEPQLWITNVFINRFFFWFEPGLPTIKISTSSFWVWIFKQFRKTAAKKFESLFSGIKI